MSLVSLLLLLALSSCSTYDMAAADALRRTDSDNLQLIDELADKAASLPRRELSPM